MGQAELLRQFGRGETNEADGTRFTKVSVLIAPSDLEDFIRKGEVALASTERGEILERALGFTVNSPAASLELSFVGLYAALESTLTFFRHQNDYENLPAEDFAVLERELKAWLKRHPLLSESGTRRSRIYEKLRELNRLPFSHVFNNFCEHYNLDLTDLWPVLGRHADWPLMEIRHRLVHGDPFASRPPEAILCARSHLLWTVQRMLLAVLGWPVAQSAVAAARLAEESRAYSNWPTERAKFA